jgi:hypothetical protein
MDGSASCLLPDHILELDAFSRNSLWEFDGVRQGRSTRRRPSERFFGNTSGRELRTTFFRERPQATHAHLSAPLHSMNPAFEALLGESNSKGLLRS